MQHRVQPSFPPEYFIQPHPFYLCSLSQVRLQFPANLTNLSNSSISLVCLQFFLCLEQCFCFWLFIGVIQRTLKTKNKRSWVLPLDLVFLGCSTGIRIFQSSASNSNMQLELRTTEMSHLPNNVYTKSSQNIGVAPNYPK